MKTLLLAAGAAALALSASSALAAPGKNGGPTIASPKQPLPYSELNAYMKASPKTRASKDWWSGADTGAAANTSATASDAPVSSAGATPPASSDTTPPTTDATTAPK